MTIKLNPFQALIDVIDVILQKNEYSNEPFFRLHVLEVSSMPQNGAGALQLTKLLERLHQQGIINHRYKAGDEIAKLTEDNEQKLFAERRRIEDKWYGHENTEKPKIGLANQTVVFNDDETNIEIGKQKCALPPFKNEHYFCRAMFQYKPQESVDWSAVFEDMAGSKEEGLSEDKREKARKTTQDTMYALNARIKKVFNTDDNLFTWENRSIKRNF